MTITLLVISNLILIVLLVFSIWSNKKQTRTEDEFVVAQTVLIEVINLYKESILAPKIVTLRSSHDLNPESRTNSIKAYQTALYELASESAKEIVKVYLTEVAFRILSKYYSVESLGLYIITQLKR